jgi:tetratricopeptide (TPR) repeat protein
MRRQIEVSGLLALMAVLVACSHPETYLVKGNQFFDQQRYAEASLNYRKAIQANPNFGQAYYRLALAEAKLNHADRSFEALTNAVRLMPGNGEARAHLGDLCLMRYQAQPTPQGYEQTSRIADQLLEGNPRSFTGLRLKGYLAFADGRPDQAIPFFMQADAIQPFVTDVVTTLVQSLLVEGRSDEAERLGNGLIGVHPDFGPIYDTLYGYYIQKSRVADAERIRLLKMEKNPTNSLPVMQLAQHYWSLNQHSLAERTIQRLLRDPKTFPEAYLNIGDFYQQNGNWDEAVRAFEAGAAMYPEKKAVYQKRVIQALLFEGRKQEVLDRLGGLTRELPDDIDLQGVRATLLVDSPKKQERDFALSELQKLLKNDPENVSFRYQLGRAYAADHRYAEARQHFESLVAARPDNAMAWLALAELASKSLEFSACRRYAEEALSRNPALRSARLLKASASVGLADYDRARSEYDKLIQEYPDYREARLQHALLDVVQGRYRDAEKEFRANYEPSRGDFRAVKGLIEMHFSQGQVEQALDLLQGESARYPSSLELKGMEASAAVHAGKWDRAIRVYERMSAESPQDGGIFLALGDAYRRIGNLPKASTALQRAQTLRPNDWRASFGLGYVYQMAGQRQEAEAQYRKCLQLNRDYPEALNNLAFLLAEEGQRLDEALSLAQRAVRASKESPQSSDTLGWIYLKEGHLDAANQIFAGLVRKEPKNPILHYHLGLVLQRRGDYAQAKVELKAALGGGLLPPEQSAAARLLDQN